MIDMGDMGSLGIGNSAGAAGLPAFDSVIPTAGEEVWTLTLMSQCTKS